MGQKRNHISISSSSSASSSSADEEEEEEDESESESESESEGYKGNESSVSTSSDDDEDDDDDDQSVIELSEDGAPKSAGDPNNVKPLWLRVLRHLQDNGDLQELSLLECRSYLQHHGLRSTGTKAECTLRVLDHWRLKDGNAEVLYPPSSFAIDCTGDVCRGDIILFKQRAFNKGKRTRRREKYPGKVTVAGRVVRESYGAGAQQHTFTIEVLWSKGINKLPLLSLRLVKGRKLYRYKTFRQPWEDESDRIKILAEKHERGAAARLVRAMTKAERSSSKIKGVKRQKHCLPERQPRPGKKAGPLRENRRKAVPKHTKSNHPPRKLPPVRRENLKRSSKARAPESSRKLENFTPPYVNHGLPTAPSYVYPQNFRRYKMQPAIQPYPQHPRGFHHSQGQFHPLPWNAAPCFPHPSSSSHHVGQPVVPQHRSLNHAHYPSYAFESRNVNPLMNPYDLDRPFHVTRY